METEESNRFALPYKIVVPQDESVNKPLPPYLSTSMQEYHHSGCTPTPVLNPYAAGSFFYPSLWANQACSTQLQYGSLHHPTRLSSYPLATGGAALAFSEKVKRIFGEKNLDSMKKCDENLQSKSVASESKALPDEGHNANKDLPSTKQQQCNMMLGNANPTELCQNLDAGLHESSTNSQLAKLADDEKRKEKKRQSNRESARRSRLRKQQESEELSKTVDKLRVKNSSLKRRLIHLSEECAELTAENSAIEEELVETYGAEAAANLMHMRPT